MTYAKTCDGGGVGGALSVKLRSGGLDCCTCTISLVNSWSGEVDCCTGTMDSVNWMYRELGCCTGTVNTLNLVGVGVWRAELT